MSATPSLALAQVQWRSGPIVYTPACDPILGGCQDNGTGYVVSQAHIASPPQPVIGQRFYVSIYLQGIVTMPRYMDVHVIPPAGTAIVADPSDPVRCFYGARNGQGGRAEFTHQVVIDNTVAGSSLRIFGCPQPNAPPSQPFALVTLSSGAGTAYRLDRRDPQGPTSTWPMPAGASYEFLIPLVSTRTLDGFSDGDRFIAPIQSIQADLLGSQWAYPLLPLLVHADGAPPPPPPPAADLQARIERAIGAPGRTRIEGDCANVGPDTAAGATCTFDGLPLDAAVQCTPVDPPSLGVGELILCSAEFSQRSTSIAVTLRAAAVTADPSLANNSATLAVDPSEPPPPSADLLTRLELGVGDPGQTRVSGRCTNHGPDAASNVTCVLGGLPTNASSGCSPASPQTTLGVGQHIECSAQFPNQATALAVTITAGSVTADPSPANDAVAIDIPAVPGGQAPLLRDGFEQR